MSLAKCLDELVSAGALSREQAEETLKDVKRQTKRNAASMAMGDAEQAAIEATLIKKMGEAKRSRELLAMQVVRQKEIDGLAQGHEYGSGWGYQSFLTKDWKGKARHANVEYRASTLVNLALSSADELSAAMAKAWGGTAEKMREMFNRAGGAASFLF